jgi:hypothetical protein
VFVAVVGLAMLAVAHWVDDGTARAWWSGVLVNVGTAVVLLGPLYFLTERLGRRIEGVRQETAMRVGDLTERVETFERDVDRRLDDVAASVNRRLAEERERDASALDDLGEQMTRPVLVDAMSRALALGVIGERRGPRVPVAEDADVFLRFDYRPDDGEPWGAVEMLALCLETSDGSVLDRVEWKDNSDPTDVLVHLGRGVHRVTTQVDLDVEWCMTRLRDTLQVAWQSEQLRPILQLCPPQWVVTESGASAYGQDSGFHYTVLKNDVDSMFHHVLEKPWVDRDSFEDACRVVPHICAPDFDDSPPW